MMLWIKKFESFKHMMSDFKNKVPTDITIYTNNGTHTLIKSDITLESDVVRLSYHHSTMDDSGESLLDGEPDYVVFDIHIIQSPKKIITDISYGDSVVSGFSINSDGIKVGNYNGIGSKLDIKTHFGFSDKTIDSLVIFYNSIFKELKINKKDLNFISKFFTLNESIKIIPLNDKKILIIDKGSDNIEYLKDWMTTRGINYDVTESLPKDTNDYIGIITCDGNLEDDILYTKIKTLLIGESFLSFLEMSGSKKIKLKSKLHDNKVLYKFSGPLFSGINTQNQFNFSTEYIIDKLPSEFITTSTLKNWPTSFDFKNFHGCLFQPEMSETTYGYLDNFMELVKPVQSEIDKLMRH